MEILIFYSTLTAVVYGAIGAIFFIGTAYHYVKTVRPSFFDLMKFALVTLFCWPLILLWMKNRKPAPEPNKYNPALDLRFTGPDAHVTAVLLFIFFEDVKVDHEKSARQLEKMLRKHVEQKRYSEVAEGGNHVLH